ncbi:SDR family oxidoreductase [Maritimibacter sp. DP07]|uniref:SDR family oxidoreductase n=1 Tax=Maritimibacter harenae TaxID=2606218 RepID=A0A845LZG4_9RHOB|nr:SDR family oxidoreductase [Maritimibacter harenae]
MSERFVVVTGGGQNIGRAISKRMSEDGWRVLVLDVAEPKEADFVERYFQVDLSDAGATQRVLSEIAGEYPVSGLVNNVGIVKPASFEDVDPEDFDQMFHLNLRTSLLCAKKLVPLMREQGQGRIVFNTSRVTRGKVDRTLYSATKGAAQSMARTWALELGKDKITVNCVAPGPIGTTAFWSNNPPDAPKTRDIIDGIPVGRMGEPDDVANAVSFFLDDRASFVTGQTLFVCGGVTVG